MPNVFEVHFLSLFIFHNETDLQLSKAATVRFHFKGTAVHLQDVTQDSGACCIFTTPSKMETSSEVVKTRPALAPNVDPILKILAFVSQLILDRKYPGGHAL